MKIFNQLLFNILVWTKWLSFRQQVNNREKIRLEVLNLIIYRRSVILNAEYGYKILNKMNMECRSE